MKKMASVEMLYNHVDFLTGIRPYRNYQNLASLKRASNYIKGHFEEFGLNTQLQQWKAEGNTYENVIARYQPEKKRKLVIGAHYDVCGDQPGADDNASAVAGLIETARLFAETRPVLDYGIEFVSYCLEEPPFFSTDNMGSFIHAESLYYMDAQVIGMICYEMIGYFSDEPGSQGFPYPELAHIYPNTGNFIMVVGVEDCSDFNHRIFQHMSKDAKIDVQLIEFPDNIGLAGMSDQRNYWKFGYDALMINDTSFMRNPHYHLESDTIDTLDFDKMAEVINSCYQATLSAEE